MSEEQIPEPSIIFEVEVIPSPDLVFEHEPIPEPDPNLFPAEGDW